MLILFSGLFIITFFETQGVDSSHFTLTDLDTLVLRLSFNLVIQQES